MKTKYLMLASAAISIVVAKPVMASTIFSSQAVQTLLNIVVIITIAISMLTSLLIFNIGLSPTLGPQVSNKKLLSLAFLSLSFCSVPSFAFGQFGLDDVGVLILNSVLIALGLVMRYR